MHLEGERTLQASRDAVWDLITDFSRLIPCLPGFTEIKPAGDNRYDGTAQISVGPIKAKFQTEMTLLAQESPSRMVVKVNAKGGRIGAANTTITVHLEEQGPQETRLSYQAEADLMGKLGELGYGITRSIITSRLDGFVKRVNQTLNAPSAGEPREG